MPKNIVICSDGTGNSWGEQVSNVARLVQSMELSQSAGQVAFYDQGIGTDPRHVNEVQGYKDKEREQRCGLTVLDPPYRALVDPTLNRASGRPGDWLRLASERQGALHGACGVLCGRGLDLSVRIQPRRVHSACACRPDLSLWPAAEGRARLRREVRKRLRPVHASSPGLRRRAAVQARPERP